MTGEWCIDHAGHLLGDGFAVQANMMASPAVWPAMAEAFGQSPEPFPRRLLAALEAGQAAGGDARGMMAAALVVVEAAAGQTPARRARTARSEALIHPARSGPLACILGGPRATAATRDRHVARLVFQSVNDPSDSVPMLSVAAPLSAALRLPRSAHRRVSERAMGSGQMSMPHQDFRGRRNLKEPAII
jgi:hypothetical protein